MSGYCRWWDKDLKDVMEHEQERCEKIRKYEINLGKANAIFEQITSDNYSEDEKLRSILTVLDMSTHNGITKDMSQKNLWSSCKIERLRRDWAGSGTGGRSGFKAHTAETKESKIGVFFGI